MCFSCACYSLLKRSIIRTKQESPFFHGSPAAARRPSCRLSARLRGYNRGRRSDAPGGPASAPLAALLILQPFDGLGNLIESLLRPCGVRVIDLEQDHESGAGDLRSSVRPGRKRLPCYSENARRVYALYFKAFQGFSENLGFVSRSDKRRSFVSRFFRVVHFLRVSFRGGGLRSM